MTEKFKNVPIEDDTTIILNLTASWGDDMEVLYQVWTWDGIKGESIIFENSDVNHFSDTELLEQISTSPMNKGESNPTITRSDCGFTFVNFNFMTTGDYYDALPTRTESKEEIVKRRKNTREAIARKNEAEVNRIKLSTLKKIVADLDADISSMTEKLEQLEKEKDGDNSAILTLRNEIENLEEDRMDIATDWVILDTLDGDEK